MFMYIQLISELFMAVLFYKPAMSTELANPALWGNAGLGSYKPLVLTFLSTAQYITLFYMHLFRNTLFNMCGLFISLNSQPIAL